MSVKEIREKLGMKRDAFCDKFKISKRTLESWEYGHRKTPSHVMRMLEIILDLEEELKRFKES